VADGIIVRILSYHENEVRERLHESIFKTKEITSQSFTVFFG
jgi:hypothetical protein